MSAFLHRLMLGALLVLASASLSSAQTSTTAQDASAGEHRQILVMLRMAPAHFRPDGYGGSYGDGEGRGARWRVAVRLAKSQGATVVDEWPMPVLGVDCYLMSVPADRSPEEVSAKLGRDPGVSWSEPLHTYRAQGGEPVAHNDPLYRVQPAAKEWRLAELHRIATGRDVRIAVIDSAIETTHPDRAGPVEVSRNFVPDRPDVPEDHGTGIAGVIAAHADNNLGMAGIAPQARLLGLRACWQETPKAGEAASSVPTLCDSLSLARALDFAISHKVQVINMSLSGPPDMLLSRLVDIALNDRIVVVAAYDRNLSGGGFPASHKGVVAVADETTDPHVAGVFSAPGHDVPTTQTGARWFLVNGSSYAAAHVSGLFALMRQHTPGAHDASALVVAYHGDTINACATLLQMSGSCGCDCALSHEHLSVAHR